MSDKGKVVSLKNVIDALTNQKELETKELNDSLEAEAQLYFNIFSAYQKVGFNREESMFFLERAMNASDFLHGLDDED